MISGQIENTSDLVDRARSSAWSRANFQHQLLKTKLLEQKNSEIEEKERNIKYSKINMVKNWEWIEEKLVLNKQKIKGGVLCCGELRNEELKRRWKVLPLGHHRPKLPQLS